MNVFATKQDLESALQKMGMIHDTFFLVVISTEHWAYLAMAAMACWTPQKKIPSGYLTQPWKMAYL